MVALNHINRFILKFCQKLRLIILIKMKISPGRFLVISPLKPVIKVVFSMSYCCYGNDTMIVAWSDRVVMMSHQNLTLTAKNCFEPP